jgi:cobyrinic acid a,c-diamide synthase
VTSAFVVAGPASGVGKTTVTLGLIQAFRRRGYSVQPFKAGPDYIDPLFHEAAAGRPSYVLDPWLMGDVRETFERRAAGADVAIVEGAMGLYDGPTGEVARRLRLPVVLVVDVWAMGASAGALVRGFRPDAVIFNRVSGPGHYELCRRATRAPVLGWVRHDPRFRLPERHLGLALEERRKIPRIEIEADLDALLRLGRRRARPPEERAPAAGGASAVVGVGRDEAFVFLYPENLEILEAQGARLDFFSPLRGEFPRRAQALYLPGGYPELYRTRPHRRLREAVRAGMPVYAECGGLMYLVGQGLLPGRIEMTDRLWNFGYAEAEAARDTVLARRGRRVRGHEYHQSRWRGRRGPAAWKIGPRLEGYARGNLHASYLHVHFAGAPECAERFVESARRWGGNLS